MVLDSPGAGVEGYQVLGAEPGPLSAACALNYWTFKRNTELTAMVCFSFGLWSCFFLQHLKPVTACTNDNVNSRRMLMRLLKARLVLRGLSFLFTSFSQSQIYFIL